MKTETNLPDSEVRRNLQANLCAAKMGDRIAIREVQVAFCRGAHRARKELSRLRGK